MSICKTCSWGISHAKYENCYQIWSPLGHLLHTYSHLCFRFPFVITLILFYSLKLKKMMTPAFEIYLYRGGRKVPPPPSRPISIELYFGTLLKASAQRKQVKYHWKVQFLIYCGTWKSLHHKDLIGSHSTNLHPPGARQWNFKHLHRQ